MPVTKGFYKLHTFRPFPPTSFSIIQQYILLAFLPSSSLSPNSLFWSIQIPEENCELWLPPNPSQLLQCLILCFYTQAMPPHPSSAPNLHCPVWSSYHNVFPPGKQPHWILGGRHWPDFNANGPVENGTNLGEEQRLSGFKAETRSCTEGVSHNPS